MQDLKLLGIEVQRVTYTSGYFEELYKLCQQLISDGNAYAEDTPPAIQKKDRKKRLASKCRERPAADSLTILDEMRRGTDFGRKHCIRARIKFDSSNGAMRDPIVYRFPNMGADGAPQPHHRTGNAWHIYPTYDFACPLVDSIEGVTHALRTTEYTDRNDQYDWFLNALNLRKVHIWDFARINFIRTFLSKRKLAKVVDSGRVSGWDDPRMPTVRGILRRGLQVNTLREFMLKQGPSRNTVTMNWTILWAMNKKLIDPVAPRHTAVMTKDAVLVTVVGASDMPVQQVRAKHPKNPAVGTKTVVFADCVQIDQVDAITFTEGEEITLMGWGNAFVRRNEKTESGVVAEIQVELNLDGDVAKTDKKVHWLATKGCDLVSAELWEFDYLLTKDKLEKGDELDALLKENTSCMASAVLDSNCSCLREGDVIQLERKGYYRVDKEMGKGPGGTAVLFKIPTGGTK
jgi:glutamyl-tRNA synthetase